MQHNILPLITVVNVTVQMLRRLQRNLDVATLVKRCGMRMQVNHGLSSVARMWSSVNVSTMQNGWTPSVVRGAVSMAA